MIKRETGGPLKILFLCTGNSARSILGEYLMKHICGDRFDTYSAGTEPTGKVYPFALRVLKEIYNIDAGSARSKSCDEYKDGEFDFVITVCDNARDVCPVWPGKSVLVHWGMPDPALAAGSDEQIFQVFRNVALRLQRCIQTFCSLPIEDLESVKLTMLCQETGSDPREEP